MKTCKKNHQYDSDLNRCPICHKMWQEANKDKNNTRSKNWYQNNKEAHSSWVTQWRIDNKEQQNNNDREWRQTNKEKHSTYQTEYKQNRRKTDSLFKLKEKMRNRLSEAFKKAGLNKNIKTMDSIGCDAKHLFNYLIGTAFKNYGSYIDLEGIYHIDHIIPLSRAKTAEDLYSLNHYTNLQLLYVEDNLSKGDK